MVLKAIKKLCPMCNAPIKWDGNPWRPFCSERCKLIDLGEWAQEKYKIETEETADEEEEENQNDNDEE